MELFYGFDFAAARYLPGLPASHPCSRMHGHTFNIEVHLRGELDRKTGWLVDFDDLQRQVATVKAELDHRCLNEIPGLELPTTEIIAEWLWQRLQVELAGLYCLVVQEHPSRGVRYYGPDAR